MQINSYEVRRTGMLEFLFIGNVFLLFAAIIWFVTAWFRESVLGMAGGVVLYVLMTGGMWIQYVNKTSLLAGPFAWATTALLVICGAIAACYLRTASEMSGAAET
jgi:hypothetical protein